MRRSRPARTTTSASRNRFWRRRRRPDFRSPKTTSPSTVMRTRSRSTSNTRCRSSSPATPINGISIITRRIQFSNGYQHQDSRQRSLSRRRRVHAHRCGRQSGAGEKGRALSLRRIDDQTVLRRHALEDRISGRDRGGGGIGSTEVIKVVVSSCLLGSPVRYDGQDKKSNHPVLLRWLEEGRVVSACPEMLGGLG